MRITRITRSPENKPRRVAAYARVSTFAEEQEESFSTQCEHYTNLISNTPNWVFAGLYSDQGVSGVSVSKRPGFQKLVGDAKERKIDTILVKSISRFARNTIDAQEYSRELKGYGVEVVFEREGITTFDESMELAFSMLAAVAQEESRSISENTKWSYRKNAEKGIRHIGNNRITGYDEIKGHLVPNQDAWIVRQIFSDFASGLSYRGIAEKLNSSGVLSPVSRKPFVINSFRRMLQNEVYIGDRLIQKDYPRNYLTKLPDKTQTYESFYIKDNHEHIISQELWEKVRSRLEKNKQRRNC